MITVPHLAVPFRITGDRAETVEDGTLEEVTQNVRVIATSYRGERLAVPDFGVGDPTFRQQGVAPDQVELEAAVEEYEPRAVLSWRYAQPTEDGTADVTVQVTMTEEG